MRIELLVALVSSFSAVSGSLVGGLISFLSTKHLKVQEWRQEQLRRELEKRENLYSEFLSETSRLLLTSIDSKEVVATKFAHQLSLLGKIRFIATDPVIEAAEFLGKEVLKNYRDPKEEKQDADSSYDRRNAFTSACRKEFEYLKKSIK